jgi:hypothetical protein
MVARAARWCAMVLAVGLLLPPPLLASPSMLPSSQIAAGMTGIGKTVILGTAISEFQVTVLGVLRNAGPAGDLVLFRASGSAIQATGGLASGMSGSPIYLGGKLAGAFSYSFQFADPMVGLFTPIDDMLRVMPGRAGRPRPGVYAVAPFSLGGRIIRRVEFRGSADPAPAAPDTAVAVPAATPLFVSGLGYGATEELTRSFEPMGLVPMAGPGMVSLPSDIPLVPGSAIAVALMQGDLAAYAIGTLTYRDGDRILAFGHPFTDHGRTEFLMTNAIILQTVRAMNHNLKVGAAGAPVGIISEDRPAAVAGTIGVLPRMFGAWVTVHDSDAGTDRRFAFQVATNKDLAPVLLALGTRGAVERALDRSGEGTAEVRMVLRGRALPRPIERANIFYSESDIATRALIELPQALHLLFDNDFADVGPTGLSIDIRITKARQTGTIIEAEMPKGPVAPGGTIRVRVSIRPFREAPVTRDIELAVPADFPEGTAMLTVRSGAPASQPGLGAPSSSGQGPAAINSLADAIAAFEGSEKSTDVVVDLTSGAQRPPAGSSSGPSRASTRLTTSWVLGGRFQAPIVISKGAY